jgi:hypothetical protein
VARITASKTQPGVNDLSQFPHFGGIHFKDLRKFQCPDLQAFMQQRHFGVCK